jgi:hypothetical protein
MSPVRRETIGFGCPVAGSPHQIAVNIPPSRDGAILVVEHFGVQAEMEGSPVSIARVELQRATWSVIAEPMRKAFNERLKEKDISGGRWVVGENKVERLLGKELCVLAWAVENASEDLIAAAVTNWLGLKPEERWWLYTVTAAATGGVDDGDIGWRKALRFALTENPVEVEVRPQRCGARKAPPCRFPSSLSS